jgi:hypothetical protein
MSSKSYSLGNVKDKLVHLTNDAVGVCGDGRIARPSCCTMRVDHLFPPPNVGGCGA